MRAAATTPAEPSGARVARFPAGGSLPRKTGGSASASYVSRPAQRSLALRPAWSLGRPWRPVPSECFRPCRCLHHPLRLLPAGATVAGRDSHPLGSGAFPRRTVYSVLHRHTQGNWAIRDRVSVGDRRGLEMPRDDKIAENRRMLGRSTLAPQSSFRLLSSHGLSRALKGTSVPQWRALQPAAFRCENQSPPRRVIGHESAEYSMGKSTSATAVHRSHRGA